MSLTLVDVANQSVSKSAKTRDRYMSGASATGARRPLIIGNWKMNNAGTDVLRAIATGGPAGVDLMICPPAPFIASLSGYGLPIGAQGCHIAAHGAHTGDISAEMLADAGAEAIIVGHSERRADHDETDEHVAAQARATWRAGLRAIICVGETEAERRSGAAYGAVAGQLAASIPTDATAENTVIAYEPVWAIGTGLVPSSKDIQAMHAHIRARVPEGIHILYGGSMKPGNAAEICALPDVDGGLIGGASLTATDFLRIAQAALSPG